jgi:quercetin dioxygenase-like cupin family protein
MANSRKSAVRSILEIFAVSVLASFLPTLALADGLPPGVTIAATNAFAPPSGLGAFQAATFVIDIAPGAGLPEHTHPGRSEVMIIQGELTENKPGAQAKVYKAGDAFIEEVGQVHSVTNKGSTPVRLVWTLLLPEGTQPIIPAKH